MDSNQRCKCSWLVKSKGLFTWRSPQIGEVACGGSPHLSCKRDQIRMRDYMDRWVTPLRRVTLPSWGPPAACKQTPRLCSH